MMDKFMKWYYTYLAVFFIFIATLILTPIFAHFGMDSLASFFYNIYTPTCHQWIYRSFCVFDDYSIQDCILHDNEQESMVFTQYTSDEMNYTGQFFYSRDQIGRMRAERVERNGLIGYKFPNDARNMGIWISLFIGGGFVLRRDPTKLPSPIWFILALIPIGIDGTSQMFALRESINILRFATGFIAGFGTSFYIYPMIYDFSNRNRKKGDTE